MPNINLISARREEKKKIETLTRQLFMWLVASGVVLMFVILVISGRQLAAHQALHQAEREWANVKPKLDEIDQLRKQSDALSPKVETLQEAKVETSRWRAVMQAVSAAMPSDAWLSGMATAGSDEDMTLNLTGVTSSQSMVGETMSRIGQQPVFDAVELRVTQVLPQSPTETVPRVTFDIGAHLKPAAAVSPIKDKDNKDTTQKADAGNGNGGNKNG
jgi:Tfp pilus assembly protein PilN